MPWEKGQVVVGLSRTRLARLMVVVSNMTNTQVALKLWGVLCKVDQWTAMTENIIKQISISPFDTDEKEKQPVLNVVPDFPWTMSSYTLPLSHVGYVYLLASVRRKDKFYVGQTKRNIPLRLQEHNSGTGANETKSPDEMPWACIAFISAVQGEKSIEEHLLSLEKKWQRKNADSKRDGLCDAFACIENGQRVVSEHNEKVKYEEDKLRLHILISRKRAAA